MLADVGLVGLPNAGKSTLIIVVCCKTENCRISIHDTRAAAGVVSLEPHRNFVIADIPGLISGAAAGAGLGTRFLKHLTRTRILLHLVDVAPVDGKDPVEVVDMIADELQQFSPSLAARERWLVLNKVDLVDADERDEFVAALKDGFNWPHPVHLISGVTGEGCELLAYHLMSRLEELAIERREDPDAEQAERPGWIKWQKKLMSGLLGFVKHGRSESRRGR